MELKDYLKLINKSKSLVIFLTLLTTLIAFLMSFYQPISYDASISFAVNRINKESTVDYQYDGYYAIQASDLVSQTVVSWLSTPSVVLEIYNKAEIDPAFDSLEKFATLFNTKKYSSQNIGVKFNETERTTAEKISEATAEVITSKVSSLNQNSESQALFEIVSSPLVIVEKKANVLLISVVGFLSGLIFSLLLVYIVNYFKEESNQL